MKLLSIRVLREYAYIAFQDPANFFDKNGNLKDIPELEEATATMSYQLRHPSVLKEFTQLALKTL